MYLDPRTIVSPIHENRPDTLTRSSSLAFVPTHQTRGPANQEDCGMFGYSPSVVASVGLAEAQATDAQIPALAPRSCLAPPSGQVCDDHPKPEANCALDTPNCERQLFQSTVVCRLPCPLMDAAPDREAGQRESTVTRHLTHALGYSPIGHGDLLCCQLAQYCRLVLILEIA